MAQNARNIQIGPARIWFGITPPVGTPPSVWMAHTNGVPATGTEVGHTDGASVFHYTLTKEGIPSEQAMGMVDYFSPAEDGELRMTLQERTYLNLKTAFDSFGSSTDGTHIGFWGGGAVVSPLAQGVFLSSPRRDNPAKFEILTLYKAISTAGAELTFGRTVRSLLPVTLKPIPDDTRTAGDQLFQFKRELG